ncbi:chorismate mutase [Motilimonas eburnea]|uniref:chorismate mutase n=1 Tax=Motilimonas eburnea TaxID=1737488 RepID=UPI001E4A0EC1|nr:chorismate mutase [Motilimonas eburnea]MCE2569909.1 chorismate mutase [Motilimonas eburnea]
MASLDLEEIRRTITELDSQLLTLLAKRKAIALDVARSKQANPRPVRDEEREQALLARLITQGKALGLDAHYITEIYHTILEDSVRSQQVYLQQLVNPESTMAQTKLAYVADSESLFAGQKYLNRQGKALVEWPCKHFKQTIHEVEHGNADLGILPIETTSAGSINEVYDLLQHTSLSIVGEIVLDTEYGLYAPEGVTLPQLTTIYCTPQIAQQSSQFLQQLEQVSLVYCHNSSEALDKAQQNSHGAVICSRQQPQVESLALLQAPVTNQQDNLSRYILIARQAIKVTSQIPAKTTLVLATGQSAGALLNVLSVFKQYNLILTKLESRPIQGNPWEEMFYIDLAANLDAPAMQQALSEITPQTQYLKVLGCYPSNEVKATQVPVAELAKIHHQGEAQSQQSAPKAHADLSHTLGYQLLANVTLGDQEEFAPAAQKLKNAGVQGVLLHFNAPLSNQGLMQHWQTCQRQAKALNLSLILPVKQLGEVAIAAKYADMLYLAGEQMHHVELLEQVGRQHRPVILCRATTTDNDNWLSSASTIMEQGNQQVILCEQGYYQSDVSQLNLTQTCRLKAQTQLPILVHPLGTIAKDELLLLNKDLIALGLSGTIIDSDANEIPKLEKLGALSKLIDQA